MKTTIKWLSAIGVLSGLVFTFACNKENSAGSNPSIPPGKSRVSVYLMDGPASFYKVLVDIRQVVVEIDTAVTQSSPDNDREWDDNFCGEGRNSDNSSVVWDTLSITPGIYDLLALRNGADTLLAKGNYPQGKILKVRITLGSDNTLYTDSLTSYPLEVFGPNPYFDVKVSRENVFGVSSNDFKLWLDFSLQRSIFFWSGTFYLKPYIIAFNDNNLGKIRGLVLPPDASALVEAVSATDTVYAVPDWWSGEFLVRGVPPGTYSMIISGQHGYNDTTLANIVVTGGSTTKIPTITLHK
jgi:hypothetical protein